MKETLRLACTVAATDATLPSSRGGLRRSAPQRPVDLQDRLGPQEALAKVWRLELLRNGLDRHFYAKERGIPVVGTPDYTVFLCAEGRLTPQRARELLARLQGSVKMEIIAQALNLLDRL